MTAKRKRKPKYIEKQYPILQGYLIEDSKTELCSTNRHKTTFSILEIQSKKLFNCVYWGFMPLISKEQLVIVKGILKSDCFICLDIKKINVPYVFS